MELETRWEGTGVQWRYIQQERRLQIIETKLWAEIGKNGKGEIKEI